MVWVHSCHTFLCSQGKVSELIVAGLNSHTENRKDRRRNTYQPQHLTANLAENWSHRRNQLFVCVHILTSLPRRAPSGKFAPPPLLSHFSRLHCFLHIYPSNILHLISLTLPPSSAVCFWHSVESSSCRSVCRQPEGTGGPLNVSSSPSSFTYVIKPAQRP